MHEQGTVAPTQPYSVVQDDEDTTYTHKVYEPNGKDYLGPNMTEAQAEIFAFGLNAIRDGFELQAKNRLGIDGRVFANELRTYDGPTEGIRP